MAKNKIITIRVSNTQHKELSSRLPKGKLSIVVRRLLELYFKHPTVVSDKE